MSATKRLPSDAPFPGPQMGDRDRCRPRHHIMRQAEHDGTGTFPAVNDFDPDDIPGAWTFDDHPAAAVESGEGHDDDCHSRHDRRDLVARYRAH